MQDQNKAMKELEIIQDVIARQADVSIKIRGWFFAIMSALIAALYSPSIQLEPIVFLIISIISLITFGMMEGVHRIIQGAAIQRGIAVEKALRGETKYDGPQIANSLGVTANVGMVFKGLGKVVKNAVFVIHWSLSAAVILIVAIFHLF